MSNPKNNLNQGDEHLDSNQEFVNLDDFQASQNSSSNQSKQYFGDGNKLAPTDLEGNEKKKFERGGSTLLANLKIKLVHAQHFLLNRWWLVLLVTISIAMSFVAVFAFFMLRSSDLVTNKFENVAVQVKAPQNLAKGSPDTWQISILNQEKSALQNIEINLNFDKSFEYIKAITPSPTKATGDKYLISRLDPQGEGISQAKIEFQGTTKGNLNEQIVLGGTISYTPDALIRAQNQGKLGAGINPRRTIPIPEMKTDTTAAQVTLQLKSASDTIQNNGEAEFTLLYRNASEKDIRDLQLKLTYPAGFNYTTSALKKDSFSPSQTRPDNGNNIWTIDNLSKLGEQTLTFRGNVSGSSDQSLNFVAEIQLRSGTEYQTISTTSREVQIASKPLVITSEITNKNGNNFNPGDTISVKVTYQNQGNNLVKNVDLVANIEDPAELIDWGSAQSDGGSRASIGDKTVRWSGTNLPQLANLPVKAQGEVSFSVKLKNDNDFIKTFRSQNEYTLTPSVKASAQNVQSVDYTGAKIKASGKINFSQNIKFVSVDPTNNNRRKYTITWELKTIQNKVTGVTIKARSPLSNTAWEPSSVTPISRVNQIGYDSSNGNIVWNIGDVPAYSGISNPVTTISFDLTTESPRDVTLLEGARLIGIDDFTGVKYDQSVGEAKVQ